MILRKNDILQRLKEFEHLWSDGNDEEIWSDGNDEEIFTELAFCILTSQSKAKVCWNAIARLKEKGLLLKGDAEQIEMCG